MFFSSLLIVRNTVIKIIMDEAMYMVKILYCQSVMRMITKHTTADNKEVNTAGKIYFFTKT